MNLFNKIILFVFYFHRKLLISILLIASLIILLFRGFSLYLEKNPQYLQSIIEESLHGEVTFEKIYIDTNIIFPTISMKNFIFDNGSNENKQIVFSYASVRINTLLSLINLDIKVDTFSIKGEKIVLHRNKKGEIFVAGFKLEAQKKSNIKPNVNIRDYIELFNQTNFILVDSEIYFVDEMNIFPSVLISDINFKMENNLSHHKISLSVKLTEFDTKIDLCFDLTGNIDQPDSWDGKVYAAIDNLNNQALLHYVKKDIIQIEQIQIDETNLNTKLWTTIEKGNLQSVYGLLEIKDTLLSRLNSDRKIKLDNIYTNFKLAKKTTMGLAENSKKKLSWNLNLFNLNANINNEKILGKYIDIKLYQNELMTTSEIQFFLDDLAINEISQLITFFLPNDINSKLYKKLKPRAKLKNILATVSFNTRQMPMKIEHYQVQLDVNQFGINSFYSLPKIRNFSTRIIFNELMGRAYIDSHDMKLYVKSLFREPWPITKLAGEFFWQYETEGMVFGAKKLTLTNPHLNASADVNFWLSQDTQIFMDLSGFYSDANVQYVPYYLPTKIMSQGLVDWLDHAFISGLGTDGGVVFRGELADFPYTDQSGTMDIVFNTKDVELDYMQGWPLLTHINSQIQFTEKGMAVESTYSKLFNSFSTNLNARISSYMESNFELAGDIHTNVADSLLYLKKSKLASNDVLTILDAKGNLSLNLNIKIPLDSGIADSKVLIKLKDTQYFPPGFEHKKGLVDKINGEILVHNNSVNSKKLTARIMGSKAQVVIKTAKQRTSKSDDPNVSVAINSRISINQLEKFNLLPEKSLFLKQYLSGSPLIKSIINLPNEQRGLSVNIRSDLKSLTSNLPGPYNKSVQQSVDLNFDFREKKTAGISTAQAQLDISLGEILSLALSIDASNDNFSLQKGAIVFNGGQAQLPQKNVLHLSGSINELPVEQWKNVFSDYNASSYNAKENPDKTNSNLPIAIELALNKLVFPAINFSHEGPVVVAKNVRKDNKNSNNVNELKNFPLINGTIDKLKLGKLDLGRFSISSSRIDNNIIFDQFTLEGNLLSFKGKGKWQSWNGYPDVDFSGVSKIASMEKLLSAMGYDELVRDGQVDLSGYVHWIGDLSDFNLTDIEANITLDVSNGTWLEGKPGTAGRLLGLLNMNALVRRLSFDFTDVSKDGFEFDKIMGKLRINNGLIYSNDIEVFSPSAKIIINGNTSLITEKINQQVTVIPEISASLPLAGAAVAGPAGAAVVWLGQKIIGDQLNKVTALHYTITGDWETPIVKRDKQNLLSNKKPPVILPEHE